MAYLPALPITKAVGDQVDKCPTLTGNDNDFLSMLSFWFSDALSPTVCIVGIVANILLFTTIARTKVSNTSCIYHSLISVLILADTVYTGLYLFHKFQHLAFGTFLTTTQHAVALGILSTLQYLAFSISTFMTVAITLERFLVGHTPIRYVKY